MLGNLHPLPKLALCLIWIGASVLVFDLRFQLVTLTLAFGLLWGLQRVALWKLLALMVPFALFGFGFLTTSVLFNAESGFALQMANEQALAAPDISPGLVLFTRALACGMVSALFALTTDPGGLVRALMVHLRLPAPVGFALMQAMHLVPDLAREMQVLRMARAMRLGRPMRRLPGPGEVMALTIPLLAFAIRRATRAALAMEARGLRPNAPRTQREILPFQTRDGLAFGMGVGVLAAVLWLV
ncbi:energy-coupling factor transporter transmembrane component T family protein [Pseudotabrizicola formosa]|uniref:energy-coupling factor transporter transmembrane component T family protein n=1 Tax=Pseudotabrizicola formosa TaxID=2030009 RepID=UPI000CD31382|nr:energy-coupling factor transporter transmembrane component T [Pseudotabrizicola formosa]